MVGTSASVPPFSHLPCLFHGLLCCLLPFACTWVPQNLYAILAGLAAGALPMQARAGFPGRVYLWLLRPCLGCWPAPLALPPLISIPRHP